MFRFFSIISNLYRSLEANVVALQAKNYLPRKISAQVLLGVIALVVLVAGGASALVITQTGSLDIRQWAAVTGGGGGSGATPTPGQLPCITPVGLVQHGQSANGSCDDGCGAGQRRRYSCVNGNVTPSCFAENTCNPAPTCPDGWSQNPPTCPSHQQQATQNMGNNTFCHRCENKAPVIKQAGQRCDAAQGCRCPNGTTIANGAICAGAKATCYIKNNCDANPVEVTTETCDGITQFNTRALCEAGTTEKVNCYSISSGCALQTIYGQEKCDNEYSLFSTYSQCNLRLNQINQVGCYFIFQDENSLQCVESSFPGETCEEVEANFPENAPLFSSLLDCRKQLAENRYTVCYAYNAYSNSCEAVSINNRRRLTIEECLSNGEEYFFDVRGSYECEDRIEDRSLCYERIDDRCEQVFSRESYDGQHSPFVFGNECQLSQNTIRFHGERALENCTAARSLSGDMVFCSSGNRCFQTAREYCFNSDAATNFGPYETQCRIDAGELVYCPFGNDCHLVEPGLCYRTKYQDQSACRREQLGWRYCSDLNCELVPSSSCGRRSQHLDRDLCFSTQRTYIPSDSDTLSDPTPTKNSSIDAGGTVTPLGSTPLPTSSPDVVNSPLPSSSPVPTFEPTTFGQRPRLGQANDGQSKTQTFSDTKPNTSELPPDLGNSSTANDNQGFRPVVQEQVSNRFRFVAPIQSAFSQFRLFFSRLFGDN